MIWGYEEDEDALEQSTIVLEVYTSYEVNTSCSCHPEYDTREYETRHSIPYAELAGGLDLSALDTYGDYFVPSSMPYIAVLAKKISDAQEAAKKKVEADRLAQVEAQKRAAEKRERDELARLQSKYTS